METDPVCKMLIDPDTAEYKREFKGQEYYFCSAGCKDQFVRNPKDHL